MKIKIFTGLTACLIGLVCYINLAQAQVRGPSSFQASSLIVEGLVGSLDVVVGEMPTMEVMLEGPDESLRKYDIKVDKGNLLIALRKIDNKIKPVKATVVLPKNTPINIKDLVGKVVVGNSNSTLALHNIVGNVTAGNLSHAIINTSGKADIKLGDVAKDLKIESKGDIKLSANKICHTSIYTDGLGQITIAEINGDLAIDMKGDANVKILGGEAHKMSVSMEGDGIVHFEGITKDPDLKMVGAGKLFIKELKGEAKLTKADTSKVQFGNRPMAEEKK